MFINDLSVQLYWLPLQTLLIYVHTTMLFILMSTASTLQRDSKHKDSSGNVLDAGAATRQAPHFDKPASKNVTALLGKTAYLNCRVKNLGNKTVSNHFTYFTKLLDIFTV